MSYKQKPQLKLYKYKNNAFSLIAIIDDYQSCSFEHNLYQAGQFTITINYNIPNASEFRRGLFVSFGSAEEFGAISTVTDAIGEEGAGSQIRTITGYDARYLLKRRVIKNLNEGGLWQMTAKGELCLRNLISDQCGLGAEEKRRLPIQNVIPATENAIGKEFSVSENFSNLYDVCVTIATQSEIGWKIDFDGSALNLVVYGATDKSDSIQFDTSFESLKDGNLSDSSDSYSNAIYIGGKGQNEDRDIYEGEDGTPEGIDRFEAWDNQTGMTTEEEYEAEALSMLNQYGQTLTLTGDGLAKCPYIYKEDYEVGDIITVAFSGRSVKVQILSVTEHWEWANYDLAFEFGKPVNDLTSQLQLMLRQIQRASSKTSATNSVKWYTIPTDSAMDKSDVFFDTIGFTGTANNNTFTLYLDDERTGAKSYNVYFKNLSGNKITLTTGVTGAAELDMVAGTYVAAVCVDEDGNITLLSSTPAQSVQEGNNNPVTSDAVYQAIQGGGGSGIEVYPTEEDLEEDLPNKNVGDLVGSLAPDLLLANIQAYINQQIKNAFETKGSYSTEEVDTGKLWIDGKHIYRKCGLYNNGASTGTGDVLLDSSLTSSYIDVIVDTGGCETYGTDKLSVGGYSGYSLRAVVFVKSGGLYKMSSTNAVTYFYWWIEYTKN